MIHLVKEYENKFVESGTKLYPGYILFNASGATNFIYELSGHTLMESEKETFDGFRLFKDKFEYLDSLGVKVSFVKTENDIFNSNLRLVDTQMPVMIGNMLENFFRGKANKVVDLTNLCAEKDVFNVGDDEKDVLYAYKFKELMTNIALGDACKSLERKLRCYRRLYNRQRGRRCSVLPHLQQKRV